MVTKATQLPPRSKQGQVRGGKRGQVLKKKKEKTQAEQIADSWWSKAYFLLFPLSNFCGMKISNF